MIELIKDYQNTMPIREICIKYNMSVPKFYSVLKANNVKLRGTRCTEKNLYEHKILTLYATGMTQNQVANKLKLSLGTVQKVVSLKVSGRPRNFYRKYSLNEQFFEKINSQEKAYVLGFLMADGHVSKHLDGVSVTVHKKDVSILYSISKAMSSNAVVPIRDNYATVGFYSHKLVSDLCKIGCTPKKTHTLKYPRINKNLHQHFIRGYFDGDGSIYKEGNLYRVAICGKSWFISDMMKHIPSGIKVKFCLDKRTKDFGYLRIAEQASVSTFINWIYDNSSIHLQRKFNIGGGLS